MSTYRPVFNKDQFKKRPGISHYPVLDISKEPQPTHNAPPQVQPPSIIQLPPKRSTKRPQQPKPTTTRKTTPAPYYPITTRRPPFTWPKPFTPPKSFAPPTKSSTTSIEIVQSKPTMEVIIGTPDIKPSSTSTIPSEWGGHSTSLEAAETTSIEEIHPSTSTYEEATDVLVSDGVTTIFGNLFTKPLETEVETEKPVNTITHHAGNEIKIMDDHSSTPLILPTVIEEDILNIISPSPTRYLKPSVLPTRFITHTQTLTVTTTKTTVIKSQGAPPSTLTLLLTQTQTSTIVDTVTETHVHTLVQPTSIVSTITTTVNQILPSPTKILNHQESTIYPQVPVATSLLPPDSPPNTITIEGVTDDESLEEFIINEPDPVHVNNTKAYDDNETIFVVMTDKKQGGVVKVPPHVAVSNTDKGISDDEALETVHPDEIIEGNDVDHVMIGGILIATPPRLENGVGGRISQLECKPDCKASRNELCQRVEGLMRCVCRPGFARMFPDRPCKRKYYNLESVR